MVHIIWGNSKIGRTFNISLPPGITCQKNVPCADKCYAKKFYRWENQAAHAWDENLEEYRKSPKVYFQSIRDFLQAKRHGGYFRWHVSGDIVDDRYLLGVIATAEVVPDFAFLIYTRYPFEDKIKEIPKNLTIIKSYWNGFDRKYDDRFPAFMAVDRNKTGYLEGMESDGKIHNVTWCKGECENCRMCWTAQAGDIILNHIH